jgi:hypothetical protein
LITRPEHSEADQLLEKLAKRHQSALTLQLAEATTLKDSIKITQASAAAYHAEYEELLSTSLARTANAAVSHYVDALGSDLSEAQTNKLVKEQLLKQATEPYHGATLDKRLAGSRLLNARRIQKSAYVGATLDTRKKNLARIFFSSYPFGAQINLDRRILLGQQIKLEHDIALAVAGKANTRIVKWTLAHRHLKKDICDSYAENVDKEVAKWLKQKKITIPPAGLYFIEDVPEPPHPNCQCHLHMLKDKKLTGSAVTRVLGRIQELLGNLREGPQA